MGEGRKGHGEEGEGKGTGGREGRQGREREGEGKGRGGRKGRGEGKGRGTRTPLKKVWLRACIVRQGHPSIVFEPCRHYNVPTETLWQRLNSYSGWEHFAIFDRNRRLSRKRYEIGPRL